MEKKIEQLCECLPAEWEVGIHIKRGEIAVSLMNPNGTFISDVVKLPDETLVERLNTAFCQANELNEEYITEEKYEA